ncbi:MAG: sigma-54 dependent transcriptional regulator [Burkholderiales bacterium]
MIKRTPIASRFAEDDARLSPWPGQEASSPLVGRSAEFSRSLRLIERLSTCDATVLIYGETGTGKELAARAIHYRSARSRGPFIPVNCGAIPDDLMESEFFGHARGAFTGAHETREGVIGQAESGSLFLDEVETLSPRGQVALLRFLQDSRYRAVGSSAARNADIRVLVATNVDLQSLVRAGVFRADLLFRLNVMRLDLPPLRSRGDDVVLLAAGFIERFSRLYERPPRRLTAGAIDFMLRHPWPGNVRELENLIHREILMSDGDEIDLAEARADAIAPAEAAASGGFAEAKAECIARFEREYLSNLLHKTGGNISMAARLCGKERSRLTKLLKKHRLDRGSFVARGD